MKCVRWETVTTYRGDDDDRHWFHNTFADALEQASGLVRKHRIYTRDILTLSILGYDKSGNSRVCFEWKVEDGR